MRVKEYEKYFAVAWLLGIAVLAVELYYRCYGMLRNFGLTHKYIDMVIGYLHRSGLLSSRYAVKSVALLFFCLPMLGKTGRSTDTPYATILGIIGLGLMLYYIPTGYGMTYLMGSVVGFFVTSIGCALLGRKVSGFEPELDDELDTFPQCNRRVVNEYSINLPTIYQYKRKMHNGWINIINPFRATLVTGTPGAGKSYSVYNPTIAQMVQKDYCIFLYDFKYPDLTKVLYNELLDSSTSYPKPPKFYVLNFNDPRYSFRCNPLAPEFLKDPTDASEIAELIVMNTNREAVHRQDFFTMSAKAFLDVCIWYLRIYEDGRYCSFPHLVEFATRDYKDIFQIMLSYPELQLKIKPFANALSAQDQLQGQLASAQMPLLQFDSPSIYWALSENDFGLDINDPDAPKIVCVGNDPKRQGIYGTALALVTSRMFKLINEKGRHHCGVLLDEVPTIFIKGLDQLIATARSNKVAIVLGAQDKSQLTRDYGEKEANVIFNTVGNVISGQVNGKTAEELSKSFGKRLKGVKSHSDSTDNETLTVAMQMQDIMPASRIETLSQGEFVGKVADNNFQKIRDKFFAGEIQIDGEDYAQRSAKWVDIPQMTYFEDEDYHTAVNAKYRQIKADIDTLIAKELERIVGE